MEQLAHLATIVAAVAGIGGPTAAMALGAVPRVGPGRAFVLGLYTRLFLRARPVSQRSVEVEEVRAALSDIKALDAVKDQYVVVAGPKGVGKTCIVETATEKTFGVVSVDVQPGKSHDDIHLAVFAAVSRCGLKTMDLSASTRRVLWWHRLFFRTPATVVLRAVERKPTQNFADLDSAARSLASNFGMCVVIDASDNSLPESAKLTKREMQIEVPPMPRAVLETVPELTKLHAALKAADLADVVWACVGGVPADYRKLNRQWLRKGSLEVVVESFVSKLLKDAIENRRSNVIANARLKELYALFTQQNEVPSQLLEDWQLARPSPDKVLRIKPASAPGRAALIPADAPTAIVLRFALAEAPPLQELKLMVHTTSSPPQEAL
jgi:hypothetical protein